LAAREELMPSNSHTTMALESVIAADLAHAPASIRADALSEQAASPGSEFVWRDAPVCRDCIKASRFSDWAAYTVGCTGCQARMNAAADPWREYEKRKRAWLENNPGAWPLEVRDACARIAEELGL